jgi:hypothetical protein
MLQYAADFVLAGGTVACVVFCIDVLYRWLGDAS